jgi:hypothetical protein
MHYIYTLDATWYLSGTNNATEIPRRKSLCKLRNFLETLLHVENGNFALISPVIFYYDNKNLSDLSADPYIKLER